MNITNEYGLPDAVYAALSDNHYVAGDNDFSATGLLNPPQQTELVRRYRDTLSIDAVDNTYSVLGTAVHNLFERYTSKDALSEKRFYLNADVDGIPYKIGGQVDFYHAGVLRDYKVTSVHAYITESRYSHWQKQLDIYTTLLKLHNYPVKHQEICMIFRDWSALKATHTTNYPKTPIVTVAFPVKTPSQTLPFIQNRLSQHVYAQTLSDSELAEKLPCSDEEMWRKPTKYAIMKRGRIKAVRVMDDYDKLKEWAQERNMAENRPNQPIQLHRSFRIEERPGECTRCRYYCSVSDYCHQYQSIVNKNIEDEQAKAAIKNKLKDTV